MMNLKIVVDHYFRKIGKSMIMTTNCTTTENNASRIGVRDGNDEIIDARDSFNMIDSFRDDIYDSVISRPESSNRRFTPSEGMLENSYKSPKKSWMHRSSKK